MILVLIVLRNVENVRDRVSGAQKQVGNLIVVHEGKDGMILRVVATEI